MKPKVLKIGMLISILVFLGGQEPMAQTSSCSEKVNYYHTEYLKWEAATDYYYGEYIKWYSAYQQQHYRLQYLKSIGASSSVIAQQTASVNYYYNQMNYVYGLYRDHESMTDWIYDQYMYYRTICIPPVLLYSYGEGEGDSLELPDGAKVNSSFR